VEVGEQRLSDREDYQTYSRSHYDITLIKGFTDSSLGKSLFSLVFHITLYILNIGLNKDIFLQFNAPPLAHL